MAASRRRPGNHTLGMLALLLPLAGPALAEGPAPAPCPSGLPEGTSCHKGQDANGSFYWIAIPRSWNGTLVVHAHGGPRLEAPEADASVEDLQRFAVTVAEGYAWAGTSYRRGGYGVRMAAEDSETTRQVFVDRFGPPRRTFLHGQSWGGNVAAKAIELYPGRYDAALLTSGVLAGGTRGYDYRTDLRAVYQATCHNHPRPEEPDYPLWMGLPADSRMTSRELAARVNECTGAGRPPGERSAEQQRRLDDITRVTTIPASALIGHLSWATFLYRDLVQKRLDGRNPFGNARVRYAGASDDAALNAAVPRYVPDPEAVAALAEDSDMTGRTTLPTLTVHAIDDPTAFVEHESHYRAVREAAGTARTLVQTFTRENVHSKLATPQYAALLAALSDWVETGAKPTPEAIAARCEGFRAAYPEPCRFDPAYRPRGYDERVPPR
ncbi:hypothetical protein LPC08_02435 [Roseomonas sp. OT10]|uniref:alpha/beta hydrolase family protein n=1 Tax=Roseomonas cutis TaxID=2897332 RepID=UPI001E4061C6|nr:hypothetical protein [Roseomonas sp. OT10]UFN49525.1 hypothetical protein LPC08_02435 [Roseomonas sp. OT10]